MIVYQVIENQQSHDGDGWNHWIIKEHHGIFATAEAANKWIRQTLDAKVAEHEAYNATRERDRWISESYTQELRDNMMKFAVGTNDYYEEHPVYFVKEHMVLE